MTNFVFATAGHIDHGKTALIKAITGVDADTSSEEKRRGITIDVGFVPFCLNDVFINFVDMPGHEKFVKNMVQSTNGINGAVLCVDAAEGVKPQTEEHVQILQLMCNCTLIVALTKCDKASETQIEASSKQVKLLLKDTLFKNANIIKTSAHTSEGINEIKEQIYKLAQKQDTAKTEGTFFMPIDRVFVKKGFGKVAAGCVLQGNINVNEKVYAYPENETSAVRQINCCGQNVKSACGTRTALNLPTLKTIKKGDVLSTVEGLKFKKAIGARLENPPSTLKSGDSVMLFIGAKMQLVRISIFEEFCFLRSTTEITACYNQKILLRTTSGKTLCGATVLTVMPDNDKQFDKREKQRIISYNKNIEEGFLFESKTLKKTKQEIYKLFFFLQKRQIDDMLLKHQTAEENEQDKCKAALLQKVLQEYKQAHLTPPSSDDVAKSLGLPQALIIGALNNLCEGGQLVCLQKTFYISKQGFAQYKIAADEIIKTNGSVNVGTLRDKLGLSRKYVKAFLEYCDGANIYKNTDNNRTFI